MSQHASAEKVEDALLDRLEDLGQIQPDFDPLEWTKATKTEQGYSTKGIQEHTIFGRTAFEDANTAFKTSDEMTALKTDNPKKSKSMPAKKLLAEYAALVDKARIQSILSKPFLCQLEDDGALIPDDQAEQTRTFTDDQAEQTRTFRLLVLDECHQLR